jgi:hypothetical protein
VALAIAAERAPGGPTATAASLLKLLRDAILLVKDLALDPRVPGRAKAVAALSAGSLVVGARLLPAGAPPPPALRNRIAGGLALVVAARQLLGAAGYQVIFDLWRGTDEGFATVLTLAGVEG